MGVRGETNVLAILSAKKIIMLMVHSQETL